MHPVLRLYEDTFNNAAGEVHLPAAPRMIFVVHGSLTIGGRTLRDGEAWHGEGAAILDAGASGATCWRWELIKGDIGSVLVGPGIASSEKLAESM